MPNTRRPSWEMWRPQQLPWPSSGLDTLKRESLLQKSLCPGSLLSNDREHERHCNDYTAPIEVDHTSDDNSPKPVLESCFNNHTAAVGACVHSLQHSNANAQQLFHLSATRWTFRKLCRFRRLWTAGIFVGKDCRRSRSSDRSMALVGCHLLARTKENRVLVRGFTDWIQIRKAIQLLLLSPLPADATFLRLSTRFWQPHIARETRSRDRSPHVNSPYAWEMSTCLQITSHQIQWRSKLPTSEHIHVSHVLASTTILPVIASNSRLLCAS